MPIHAHAHLLSARLLHALQYVNITWGCCFNFHLSYTLAHIRLRVCVCACVLCAFKIQSVSIYRAIYQSLRAPNYKKMKALLGHPSRPPSSWPAEPEAHPTKNTLVGSFVVVAVVVVFVVVNGGYLISY